MPNKHAAAKAWSQMKKHALENQIRREAVKETIKKVTKAAGADEAKKLIAAAQKALDKAAKTGVIKKNTAARRLSRLMKKVYAKK